MSKDKDRENDKPKIYPSNYIDYTPQAKKSSRRIKVTLFAVFFMVFLLFVLLGLPRYFADSSKIEKIPDAIQEIAQRTASLSNDLATQTEKLAKGKDSQMNGEKLPEIVKIETQLKGIVGDLQEVKKKLDAESKYLRDVLKAN